MRATGPGGRWLARAHPRSITMSAPRTLLRRAYPPDGVTHVVSDEESAGFVDGDADGAARCVSSFVDEAAENIQGCSRRNAVFVKGDKDNLVPTARRAIPRAVLSNEHAARKPRQRRSHRRSQPEGRGVCAEGIVGDQGGGDEVRPRRLDPRVDVAAEVRPRKAVSRHRREPSCSREPDPDRAHRAR